jgi:N-acylneuraminate cytidylyltransferase
VSIAIIPARGGSKRIPHKNIKLFHGKPIIAYSIEAALKSNCFERIVVSTDCSEIAAIAKSYGAEVPFIRPSAVSDDFSTTLEVMQHAIDWFEKEDEAADLYCCIYATAPFVQPYYIQQGLLEFSCLSIEYALSVTTFQYPIQRALSLSTNRTVSMLSVENLEVRSQDLIEAYHDAGQFYWGRANAFKLGKPIFSQHSKAIVLPRKFVQDIDTLEDWELAEALFRIL